jgi:hypothetical protein
VKTFLLKKQVFPIAFVYLLLVLLLQLVNGWYENFSDAVHYLWISDKYAEGDWLNAVNTYWGPMISWLLLLFKPFIAEPFVRFRLLQIILGFTALWLLNKALRKNKIEDKYALLFSITAIPLIAYFTWFFLTPDLLLLNGILITILFYSKERERNWKTALLTALAGALLFYIKSIGLYLFLFLLAGKFLAGRGFRSKQLFLHSLLTVIFLLVICSPWIALISWKHGSFTMGTSSVHNYKMNSPRITPDIYGEVGNPYHLGTLTEPNPPNAFDACMEHMHQPYFSWEGMSKGEIAKYYGRIIIKNLKSVRSMFFGLDVGTIFCALLLIAFFTHRKLVGSFLRAHLILLLIFFANLLLYLPFFFMDRYVWPGLISFYLLSVFALFYFPVLRKTVLILSVSAVFFLLNCYTLYKEYSYSLPEKPITEEIWKTRRGLKMDRTIWLCSKEDKRLGVVKGLIYYNKGQYLGALFYENNTPENIEEQVKKFHINTIVTLEDPARVFPVVPFPSEYILESPAVHVFHIESKEPSTR